MIASSIYEKYEYLVDNIYKECLDSGYDKQGAAGKLKYELEPMATKVEEKICLYFELCYLYAKEDLLDSFLHAYESLRRTSINKDLFSFINIKNERNVHYKNLILKRNKIVGYEKNCIVK
ncbi:hypothetical protein [Bacillus thuringiensis]|uniref:hypothetical protein n=1 Tax=Bacillus thuringiensis TaxID=1428 RepID=UPI0021D69A46|nr:hypothetical protein [Bacillus thuringiensis]MCU7668004.1 hypothetical protein [Bacillus thuringiensis]